MNYIVLTLLKLTPSTFKLALICSEQKWLQINIISKSIFKISFGLKISIDDPESILLCFCLSLSTTNLILFFCFLFKTPRRVVDSPLLPKTIILLIFLSSKYFVIFFFIVLFLFEISFKILLF